MCSVWCRSTRRPVLPGRGIGRAPAPGGRNCSARDRLPGQSAVTYRPVIIRNHRAGRCAGLLCATLFALLAPCGAHAGEAARALDYRVGKFFGAVDAHVVVRTYTNEAGAQEQSTAVAGRSDRFALMVDLHRQPAAHRDPPYGLVDPNSPAMLARYKAAARERLSVDVGGVKYRLHGLRGVGAKYSVSPNESYEASVRRSSVTGKPRLSVEYRQAF